MPKLFLLPVSIAEDTQTMLPPYLSEVVASINYFLVENERTARRFISGLQLGINVRELKFFLLDKKTKPGQLAGIFKQIPKGEAVGVMSEAGCPGIADPGALAVAHAHRNSWEVIPIPGPSSIFLALMASGMNGQGFAFHGYLPIDKKKKIDFILKLEKVVGRSGHTQIFMETPYRNQQLFNDIISNCSPNTRLCIARDLTGKEQLVKTLSIGEWKGRGPELHKRPTIFLLGN